MSKFISVLISKRGLDSWEAVQESDTLAGLQAQKKYRAGNNFHHDKSPKDKIVGEKQITEENTGDSATVIMIELGNYEKY